MNANVDYTAELRELVQDDINFPRKLKKEYFNAHGVDFHYIVKCEIDNKHELDYLVATLAAMGHGGAYMCIWFITDDNFWMTSEALHDRVMEEIRAAEKRQEAH
ncbi:uncharacterized protein J4E79_002516 [Alternaria viburni]|uniref:uncharacterized protein n=1 Tax=Alternaria viburni TaxID=566460 RepID=UPI0020C21680|nr:uncharacterized protein J4E79_002516 [Alternaria viburni]KAI4666477.1 hypothetical protein J4E79_002516 [Alternaria viburni]